LLASPPAGAQQPDFSKIEVRVEQLAPNLHVLFGAGGNVAVLTGDDGAVVVDDQFAPMAPKIRAAIALLTDKPVKFVINTHWHPDHAGGNAAFGRGGRIIIAHENTLRRLSSPQLVDFFNMKTEAEPAAALPVVTFTDSVDLHLDGEDIAVVHVANAHTDSDAVLYFRNADAVHAGDVFTQQGGYPFIDLGSGGSIDGVIAATREILARIGEHTRVIPGHGPLATRADVVRRLAMLVAVRERIAAQLRRGRSLAQVIDSRPTKDFDAQYGGGAIKPDVWVQRVYLDLARTLAH
jgi:glyoxylase-like metal-dependent hydrolase (beta-lactamase superfamily II)